MVADDTCDIKVICFCLIYLETFPLRQLFSLMNYISKLDLFPIRPLIPDTVYILHGEEFP